VPPTHGDFADLYARGARSPKRIFLPRRHALKGLGAAAATVLVVAGTATALSRFDPGALTAVAGPGSAKQGGAASPGPDRAAGQAPASPTRSASPSPPKPSASRPSAPATVTVQPPAPVVTQTVPGTATASPSTIRADLFTVETNQGARNPDFSLAEVWVDNTEPVSDLDLEIRIVQTGTVRNIGLGAYNQTNHDNAPVPEGDLTLSVTQTSGDLVYRFSLNDGVTLQPGRYQLQATYSYTGDPGSRYTGGDSFTLSAKDPATGALDEAEDHFG
jgi:hypothetical protein